MRANYVQTAPKRYCLLSSAHYGTVVHLWISNNLVKPDGLVINSGETSDEGLDVFYLNFHYGLLYQRSVQY